MNFIRYRFLLVLSWFFFAPKKKKNKKKKIRLVKGMCEHARKVEKKTLN